MNQLWRFQAAEGFPVCGEAWGGLPRQLDPEVAHYKAKPKGSNHIFCTGTYQLPPLACA